MGDPAVQPLRESYIEKRFALLLEGWAKTRGIKLFCHKFEVPGRAGYPDRLVLCWPGQSIFIEFKRPGEKPRDLQLRIHELLREMGFTVLVHDNELEALEDVKSRIVKATSLLLSGDRGV
jgi:hypothetical protein